MSFEQLKLHPDKLDIHRINNLLAENINVSEDNEDLLDHTFTQVSNFARS